MKLVVFPLFATSDASLPPIILFINLTNIAGRRMEECIHDMVSILKLS